MWKPKDLLGSNSGCQAWQQTESSCQPLSIFSFLSRVSEPGTQQFNLTELASSQAPVSLPSSAGITSKHSHIQFSQGCWGSIQMPHACATQCMNWVMTPGPSHSTSGNFQTRTVTQWYSTCLHVWDPGSFNLITWKGREVRSLLHLLSLL